MNFPAQTYIEYIEQALSQKGTRGQGFQGSSEMIKNYNTLQVWQKSYGLCLEIFGEEACLNSVLGGMYYLTKRLSLRLVAASLRLGEQKTRFEFTSKWDGAL